MERQVVLKACVLLLGISTCLAHRKIDLGFLVDDWSTSPRLKTKDASRADARVGESVKDLIRTIYGSFPTEDDSVRVGLVKSGATAQVVFDFNAYKDLDSLDEAVEELTFPKSADSNIGKALDVANYGLFKNSGRPGVLKFLVVIAQTKSTDDVNRAARKLRNSGVNILSAWSGKRGLLRDDLQSILSPPKQYNLFKGGEGLMYKLAPLVVNRIRYVASRTNAENKSKQQREGNKCSKRCDVKVEGDERIKIDCSNCKLVGCCGRCCKSDDNQPFYPGPVELVILLDESGELKNWENFNMMKSFIKNLTQEFDFANKKTKIGIISFTDTNLQVFDLHSFHDDKNIDSQIEKLNYEGLKTNSGSLNKALDAAQVNLFTDERDLSVPRLMLVFDSAAKKDDQTEVKAFKLQESDVQTFCIGLGTGYDKTECNKIVEKPYQSHSLSAQVAHLGELEDAIMLMIVNDIAGKYCPSCAQGTNDACRPCKTARRYTGSDESKSLQDSGSNKVLKLIGQGNGQGNHLKPGLKLSDSDETEDDEDDTAKLGSSKPVQLLGGTQVGTPLPSVELVKDLLQTGTALNSDANTQIPLIANGQSLLPQSPTLVQPGIVQKPLQTQQLVQHEQQQNEQQSQQNLNNVLPQVASTATSVNGNQGISSMLFQSVPTNSPLTNEDKPTDNPSTVQPVFLKPSSLSQALLRAAEFQRQHAGKSENTNRVSLENGLESSSLPLGALSTLPVQDSDYTDQIASFQGKDGMMSLLPSSVSAASLPEASRSATSDADALKAAQFQSPLMLPDLQLPMQLNPPAQRTNLFGFPPASVANKKSPLVEYKYDLHDKQGRFVMDCKDLSDECASYATEGGCDEFAPLSSIGDVKTMCKKSCGLCESNTETGRKKSQTKQRRISHRNKRIGWNRRKKFHQ